MEEKKEQFITLLKSTNREGMDVLFRCWKTMVSSLHLQVQNSI